MTAAAKAALAALVLAASPAAAFEDRESGAHSPEFVVLSSDADFETTLARLKAALDERDLKTFAVIDHAAGADSIDKELRPTTLVIFGDPRAGTPLMQAAQTMGLDLPLKALVYESADGGAYVAYPSIAHLADKHAVQDRDRALNRIAGALAAIGEDATQAE